MENSIVSDDEFWNFSVYVYEKTGVWHACHELQNNYAANINVILYCLWHCKNGGRSIALGELLEILERISAWHYSVTQPLRSVRQSLKEPSACIPAGISEKLRTRIKRAELEAERVEQQIIKNMFSKRIKLIQKEKKQLWKRPSVLIIIILFWKYTVHLQELSGPTSLF